MRVLFVPHPMPSHVIPLIALARKLSSQRDIAAAFLLPRELHGFASRLNINVLNIDRRVEFGLRPEMMALASFKPQIVIDDLSPTTALFARYVGIPRVSIVRKGIFPGDHYPPLWRHSSNVQELFERMRASELEDENVWLPSDPPDLFVGDLNLVPSIPEIEILPEALARSGKYSYVGPLLLSDEELMSQFHECVRFTVSVRPDLWGGDKFFAATWSGIARGVAEFFRANSDRPIVYFTVGLGYPSSLYEERLSIVDLILRAGAAVITNVAVDAQQLGQRAEVFCAPYLPMNLVCAGARVMIHQCGSGTYSYQILHACPAIILGTSCFDRDAVAEQLERLGAAVYISAQQMAGGARERFSSVLRELLNRSSDRSLRQRQALAKLRQRFAQVSGELRFADALRELLDRYDAAEHRNSARHRSGAPPVAEDSSTAEGAPTS